jgi:hypothetical protein
MRARLFVTGVILPVIVSSLPYYVSQKVEIWKEASSYSLGPAPSSLYPIVESQIGADARIMTDISLGKQGIPNACAFIELS